MATSGAEEPGGLAWVVGRLAVAYEEADDRIVVVAEEFLEIPDDELEALDLDDPATLIAAGYEPATARFRLTRAQVAAFIAVGERARPVRPTAVPAVRPAGAIPRGTRARG